MGLVLALILGLADCDEDPETRAEGSAVDASKEYDVAAAVLELLPPLILLFPLLVIVDATVGEGVRDLVAVALQLGLTVRMLELVGEDDTVPFAVMVSVLVTVPVALEVEVGVSLGSIGGMDII